VRSAMQKMKADDTKAVEALIQQLIKEIPASNDKRLLTLLDDVTGQVKEAFSKKDFYKKWGLHYLPSLMRAHLLQQCNNFKDPGIQNYGGELFRRVRDEADDIFCKLPPPKPSIQKPPPSSVRSNVTRVSAPVSMSYYNSPSNPCFDGDCQVFMADGSQKKVKFVEKGDRVMTPNKNPAEVLCVVKTICRDQKAELVELQGGLLVTPYHPVRIDGKWNFPRDLGKVTERSCASVYSFVLKDGHVMVINGVECVTLGHEFQDEVVQHNYFGSKRVIEDLQKSHGWSLGLVQFNSGCLVRDVKTGLVCGFHDGISESAW